MKVATKFQNITLALQTFLPLGRQKEQRYATDASQLVEHSTKRGSDTTVESGTHEPTLTQAVLFTAGDVLKLVRLSAEYSLDQKILINLTCKMPTV